MKKLLIILLIPYAVFSQTPCDSGFAGTYPCNDLDLLSFMPNGWFGASSGNDSWGWTDPSTGNEYAIYCNSHNTAFIDITNPLIPIYLGKLNTHTSSSTWRDAKVYNNHVFIVSEASGHGMQVFDLTRLRSVANPPEIFTEDAHESSFGHAHNIAINEDTGYAYVIGASAYNGGPIFINIQDPLNPINEGGFGGEGYSHDAQIVIYDGPDTEHVGKEIYFGPNESSVVIIDVTNKATPIVLSEFTYSNNAYTHQLWASEDHQYLFVNDELDEQNFGNNTRNIVYDISDLDNPVIKTEYFGPTTAIDHNNYVVGDKLYIANYRAGIRVVDISDIENGNMNEIAYFDTYPSNNNANFDGAWSVYPYFESGNIVISDINLGCFIVRDSNSPLATIESKLNKFSIYPNPVNNQLFIKSDDFKIETVEVFNLLGERIVLIDEIGAVNKFELDTKNLELGIYLIKINNTVINKFIKE